MSVVHGPWGATPVEQPTPQQVVDGWWHRDGPGRLWVWCTPTPEADNTAQWHQAPVPLATVTRGIPARSPNRDRITAALDMRMMHGPEVDEALGVHNALDTTVDAWEAGTEVPTGDEVRRLATLTGFPPEWFYQGTLPQLEGAIVCGRGGCRRVE